MNEVVDKIYKLRRNFILVGLTGRTGSGCSTVADVMRLDLEQIRLTKSNYSGFNAGTITNDVRKDRIVRKFIDENWHPFKVISASNIIFYYAFQLSFDDFVDHIEKSIIPVVGEAQQLKHSQSSLDSGEGRTEQHPIKFFHDDASKERLKAVYEKIQVLVLECETYINNKRYIYDDDVATSLRFERLITEDITYFRRVLDSYLTNAFKDGFAKELQKWGNNIRQFDSIDINTLLSPYAPACLAHKINQFIKMMRESDKRVNPQRPTLIVIDALRNPYEILYFRERYSAFYTFSVHTETCIRHQKLFEKGYRKEEVDIIDENEKAKKDFQKSFQLIDIDKCIELSDIHLTHDGTPIERNRAFINQIFTYISLILHPGLIPPSPQERIMQIAYTAKLNSGCLSRQVGAVLTNQFFSVQSIGWNTVAQGQTPCSLRYLYDLYEQEDKTAFSEFEKTNLKFKGHIALMINQYSPEKIKDLKGVNLAYCFKDVYTTIEKEKQRGNQVHTRSLHAEENAFLQLAKYGSQGIVGGKLFTTASCCELCGKKAYQLGIEEIYYIDTYPGITKEHILECGDNTPQTILFSGAIGRAYLNLYNPFLPLKDEIEAVTGVKVKELEDNQIENSHKMTRNGTDSKNETSAEGTVG